MNAPESCAWRASSHHRLVQMPLRLVRGTADGGRCVSTLSDQSPNLTVPPTMVGIAAAVGTKEQTRRVGHGAAHWVSAAANGVGGPRSSGSVGGRRPQSAMYPNASTIRWVRPRAQTRISPLGPTGTVTVLAVVSSAVKLTLETSANVSHGVTVTSPALIVDDVAVLAADEGQSRCPLSPGG